MIEKNALPLCPCKMLVKFVARASGNKNAYELFKDYCNGGEGEDCKSISCVIKICLNSFERVVVGLSFLYIYLWV